MPQLYNISKQRSISGSFFILILLALFSSNCASIFKGSSAAISMNSTPTGATVLVNNIEIGLTPNTFFLSRNKDHVITFQKDGYEDVSINISRTFDLETSVIGNLFSWSIVGFCVDYVTGAAFSLTPADLQANFDSMAKAGLIDPNFKQKKGEIMVIMVTTEQWEAIQAAK
jgi:hypothetical protein